MTYPHQRLVGALLGFLVVGPLVTGVVAAVLGAGVGTVELLLGAVLGAGVGAYVAGRVAATKDGRARG